MSNALAATVERELEQDNIMYLARDLQIITPADNGTAAEFLRSIALLERKIHAAHDPVVMSTCDAHRKALGARDAALDPLKEVSTNLRKKMADYNHRIEMEYRAEVEKKRREAEAEAERLRVAARAEAERKQAEEMERRKAEAEALRKLNSHVAAEAIESYPVAEIIPEPIPNFLPEYVPPPPKVSGVSFRTTLKPEVVSLKDLCLAIAGGTAPENLVKPDMPRINDWLKCHPNVPGVQMIEVKSAVVAK
jgi:hypothetical protein